MRTVVAFLVAALCLAIGSKSLVDSTWSGDDDRKLYTALALVSLKGPGGAMAALGLRVGPRLAQGLLYLGGEDIVAHRLAEVG
jgi:hypothetical protein